MGLDVTLISNQHVHRLPRDPVHLYQFNSDPAAYQNAMGCGAFCTAMGLSYYDPSRFGTYAAARTIFASMLHVPFFGGTFESQNAVMARKLGYFSQPFDHGSVADLTAAIDCGAPTVLLINPGFLGIGTHDVLLVGYGTDEWGGCICLFVNNPAIETASLGAPMGLSYPGNQIFATASLQTRWTRCFTPFFDSQATFDHWRTLRHRL
jgi:hypothetical protein